MTATYTRIEANTKCYNTGGRSKGNAKHNEMTWFAQRTYQLVSTGSAIGLKPHQSFLPLQNLQLIFGWINHYRVGIQIIYWGWRVWEGLIVIVTPFHHQYFNFFRTQRCLESNILYTQGMHSESIKVGQCHKHGKKENLQCLARN